MRRRKLLNSLRGGRLTLLLALLLSIAFSIPSSEGAPQAVAEESQETSFFDAADSEAADCSSFQLPFRETRSTALHFLEQVRPRLSGIRSETAPRAPPRA